MKISTPVVFPAAIGAIVAGALPHDILANLRVVDAGTGETIDRVLEADVAAGKLARHEVKDGNLVREGDAFKIIEEERAIRIEWIVPPSVTIAADEEGNS